MKLAPADARLQRHVPNLTTSFSLRDGFSRKDPAAISGEGTVFHMIVHHSGCLHVRITDGGAKKLKATLLHVFGDSVRFLCADGYLPPLPMIDYGFIAG